MAFYGLGFRGQSVGSKEGYMAWYGLGFRLQSGEEYMAFYGRVYYGFI